MHDEDPKNRPHNTLGFGVLGSVYINDNQIFIGQTGSTLTTVPFLFIQNLMTGK